MATASLLSLPKYVAFDQNGNPLSGGLVTTSTPGGGPLRSTWQDAAMSIANSNPIVLNADGAATIYGTGIYQFDTTDALGNIVDAYSGIVSAPLQSGTFATIADLRANALIVTAPYEVEVTGYYVPGDAGAGDFIFIPSDHTSIDNGGTIVVDAAGQRWFREIPDAQWSVMWFGAKADATTDDTDAINAALAAATPGRDVWLSATGRHLCDSTITVPKGVALHAGWNVPGSTNSSASSPQSLDLTTLNGALILASTATITLNSSSALRGVPVYRQGLVIPAADSSAFAGTAITVAGDDVYVGYCLVLGFAQAYYSVAGGNSFVRQKIEWLWGDNNAGIRIDNSHDTPNIMNCHFWPFCTYSASASAAQHFRTGTAYDVTASDLPSLRHNFCISYKIGYHIGQCGGALLLDCQADGIYDLAIGFRFDTGIEGSRAIGCTAFANAGNTDAVGYVVDVPTQDYMEFSSCYSNTAATAYQIYSGDVKIIGGTVDAAVICVTVVSPDSFVTICGGFRAEQITNAVVFNQGGGGGIYVSPDCDFIRLNLGGGSAGVSTTMAPFVIPSAGSIDLPRSFDFFEVSGTTTINALFNGWSGRRVRFVFDAALVITHSHVADGISLVGSANVTTIQGMSIDLIHNGFQWFEAGHVVTTGGGSSSLTSPGWRIDVDGTIENWALVVTDITGHGTFTFAQPFVTAMLSVQGNAQGTIPSDVVVVFGAQTTTSIPVYTAAAGVGIASGVFCRAIGH